MSSGIVTLITGNQAADADSVVSALTLAFTRARAQGAGDGDTLLFVPVVSTTRTIFERTHPLEPFFMGPILDLKLLLYMDEELETFKRLHEQGRLRVILTVLPAPALAACIPPPTTHPPRHTQTAGVRQKHKNL